MEETLSEIERTQQQLRETIQETKRLADESEALLRRQRPNALSEPAD